MLKKVIASLAGSLYQREASPTFVLQDGVLVPNEKLVNTRHHNGKLVFDQGYKKNEANISTGTYPTLELSTLASLLTPGTTSPNVLWLFRSDENVTVIDGKVSTWLSSNEVYTLQPLTVSQPIIDSTDLLNNIAPIRFTEDKFVSTTNVNLPSEYSLSILVRGRNTTHISPEYWDYLLRLGYIYIGCHLFPSSPLWNMLGSNISSSADGNIFLFTFICRPADQLVYNGSNLVGSATLGDTSISALFYLGGAKQYALSDALACDNSIWEICAWDGALSEDNLASYIQEVNTRYGLAIT